MAIELPQPVVDFLQVIGINWPQVNEDKVREFATHVQEFASNIEDTHGQVNSTLQDLGQSYQGKSYELLISKWAALSQNHMTGLLDACKVVAVALDGAADAIVGLKLEAIGELVAMAAAFVADQAAAVVTFGLSEAALPLIEEGAEKLMEFAEQQIEQYIIGQILNAALKPLIAKMEGTVEGLLIKAESSVLGVSAGPSFSVDLEQLDTHAEMMRGHAETISGHVSSFTSNVRGLDFSS